MGYDDRNSALDTARQSAPTPAVTNPQMIVAGPPLGRPIERLAASAVQEFRIEKARPSIAKKEKLRSSCWSWPRAASCAASLALSSLILDTFNPSSAMVILD